MREAGSQVGTASEDRDALAFADPDVILWVGTTVKSWARPGGAGKIHSSCPAGLVTTCTFTPCRRCLCE